MTHALQGNSVRPSRCFVIGLAACVLLAAMSAAPGAGAAQGAPDAARGALLYENHCGGCHTSAMHIRQGQHARSFADVSGWEEHWARYNKLDWSDDDVADVTAFLMARYYHFTPR